MSSPLSMLIIQKHLLYIKEKQQNKYVFGSATSVKIFLIHSNITAKSRIHTVNWTEKITDLLKIIHLLRNRKPLLNSFTSEENYSFQFFVIKEIIETP